jgi:hypothetical protein
VNESGRGAPSANWLDWLIVALCAVSTAVYFLTSLGARGQLLFVVNAAMKVLARLGIHS